MIKKTSHLMIVPLGMLNKNEEEAMAILLLRTRC